MPPKGQLSDEEIALISAWVTDFRPASPGDQDRPSLPANGLPSGIDPRLAIDVLLETQWREDGVEPAPAIDDGVFLRRLSLDLLGRIPTTAERDRFLADTDSRKRTRLVDELLASRGHARHLAEIFNVVLLGRELEKGKDRGQRESHLLPYLRWAFESNRPWNLVGHDLIVARPEQKEAKGASWFLYEQSNDANKMATATSAALFGKQVQCAQCHDHPVAPEIEQRHYWGLVAFFDRSVNVTTNDGIRVAERAAGGYAKFANLEGESSQSELVFLTDARAEEPGGRRDQEALEHYLVTPPDDWINPPKPKKKGEKPKITTKVESAPRPKFSRREALASLAIEDNPAFSRAIVNRMWALLMGRGFVHPVDRMDSAHPPSHPELLSWLAEDFAANRYDLRRLTRAIVSSRAYALSAIHPGETRPLPQSFAYALDKPLPAEALSRSMLVALGAEVNEDGSVAGEQALREVFVRTYPDLFPEVFSPSVQQATFATNSDTIDRLLRDEAHPLTRELTAVSDDEVLVKRLFTAVFGRSPDSLERDRSVAYLRARADRRPEAIRQLLWALFHSAEFRMNH